MKAILVIDLPKNCAKCKLAFLQGIGEGICNAVDWDRRPSWCPLKPLPQRIEQGYTTDDYTIGKADGWNACLEEITGETE